MTATLQTSLYHLIGGEQQHTTGGERTGAVYNPATGEQTGTLPFADATTLEHAVDIAAAALPGWRATGMAKRANIMFNLRQIIVARRAELAAI
ncbi:aldehyde dehydrogenase family protein, partial [Corynebacterium variabile]|uniref:aldehyde dehydrogenase family protein n=1 Tax=Corynebacterium variabile TaxID=1727 RepID=UPI003BAE6F81